jgi:hypothetical protein
MPGTLGDSDLYKIALNEDGTFGAIEHLNDKINTEGRETFPFVTNSNMLIFSSNGHPGLGGLDLYSYDLNDPNAVVISLGAVINSPYDDFGLAYNSTTTKGFYSSNKPGAMGDDDIYSFDVIELPKPLIIEEPKLAIKGLIKDDVTNEALPNVNLVLVDQKLMKMEHMLLIR